MTAAVQTATLPTEGRHIVETTHSAYIIDMDAQTFERWPAAPEAAVLQNDGAEVPFDLLHCTVGVPMRILHSGAAFYSTTTPVVSITGAR